MRFSRFGVLVGLLISTPGAAQVGLDWSTVLSGYPPVDPSLPPKGPMPSWTHIATCLSAERPDSVEVPGEASFEMQAFSSSAGAFLDAQRPDVGSQRFAVKGVWCFGGGDASVPAAFLLESAGRWVRLIFAAEPHPYPIRYRVPSGGWEAPGWRPGRTGPVFGTAAGFAAAASARAREDSVRAREESARARRVREDALRLERMGFSPATVRMIQRGQIAIGWSAAAVRESLGKPDQINRTITRAGTHEQWVYQQGYVYLDNGRVTAIQESQ